LKLLIIRPGALGDTLMLLPALVNLSGQVDITLVARQPGLYFIRDFVNRAMDLDGAGWHRLFLESPAREGLPVTQADVVVAFLNDKNSSIRRNLNAYFPSTPIHLFPSFPKKGEKIHVARYISNCIKSAGISIDPRAAFEIAVKHPLMSMERPLHSCNTVVVHPGSGGAKKNQPPDFWLKILGRFGREPALKKMASWLLLGPAEVSLHSFFRKNLASTQWEICFCPDHETLTGLLGKTCLYLGHDSGITHLAAMLGIPSVALFTESNAVQWHPLGPAVQIVQKKGPGIGLIKAVLKAAMDLSHTGDRDGLNNSG
jgi:heptosyltransferase-3